MPAGDITFTFDVFSVDADNRVTIRTTSSVVGKDNASNALRPTSFVFTPNAQLLAQIEALRASILAGLTSSPPDHLKGQTNVPAPTEEQRRAARDTAIAKQRVAADARLAERRKADEVKFAAARAERAAAAAAAAAAGNNENP